MANKDNNNNSSSIIMGKDDDDNNNNSSSIITANEDDNNNSSSIIMAKDEDNSNNLSSIIMANDENNNNSSSISLLNVGPSPKGSIEYVRVDKIDDDDDEAPQLIFGGVIATDCEGNYIAYHRPSVRPDSIAPGEYLSLSGPVKGILAESWFSISVNLWVKSGDHHDKQIAQGLIYWNPFTVDDEHSMGKPLEQVVGSVTVGFSIIGWAFNATIDNVVIKNELLPAQIYGTIKAFRFLSSGVSSPTPWMLFDKLPDECVQVNPGQSIPLTRPFFPVRADSDLTIDVELWNHANDQIAVGTLQFTPTVGTKTKNITGKYGEVQVSITFN